VGAVFTGTARATHALQLAGDGMLELIGVLAIIYILFKSGLVEQFFKFCLFFLLFIVLMSWIGHFFIWLGLLIA